MRSTVDRVPRGLGSLLLGAIAAGFVGAIVARQALVGFEATLQIAAVSAVTVGLTIFGIAGVGRGFRRLRGYSHDTLS